jgi:hypothetical protein
LGRSRIGHPVRRLAPWSHHSLGYEEHAEAAEQTLAERRLGMASSVGLSVESTELLEAIAVEVPAAAHA